MGHTFRTLGIQQIAIGSLDAGAMHKLWVDLLGVDQTSTFRSERENVDEKILELPDGVEIDLMTPIDPDKSPKVHDPALNHIGIWVSDIHAAVKELTEAGVRFTPGGIRQGAAGYEVCFIHPKGNEESPIGGCGVLIELVQAPEDVINGTHLQAS